MQGQSPDNKASFRKRVKKDLSAIVDRSQDDGKLSYNIHKLLKRGLEWDRPIGVFAPLKDEPQFDCVGNWNWPTAFPKFQRGEMVFVSCQKQQLEMSQEFGVELKCPPESLEEIEPELLLVPGLAFTKFGHRLGRGKGFYDKYLSKKKCITIGICLEVQIWDEIPVEQHDRVLEYIVTDRGIWHRGNQILIGD